MAIDGNPATLWHNADGPKAPGKDWLQIDLGTTQKVLAVHWNSRKLPAGQEYLYRRQGLVEVRVSNTPVTGGKQVVTVGTLCFRMPRIITDSVHNGPETNCGQTIQGRYIIFTNPIPVDGDPWWDVAVVKPIVEE